MYQFVSNVSILPGFQSDHSIVSLSIVLVPPEHGPGYWKLNTSLLKDPDYIERINRVIDIELGHTYPTLKQKWENLKLSVRGSTVQYASWKQKSRKNKTLVLEKKLKQYEDKQVAEHPMVIPNTEQVIMELKRELEEIYAYKTKGAVLRCGKNYSLLGEKPTKYFLNLEKFNQKKRAIYCLQDESGQVQSGSKKTLSILKQYYENLYSTKGQVDLDYIKKLDIPKISQLQREKADSPITMSEVSLALKRMASNKCPSTDGLPPEFYKVFWPKIKDFMLDLYLEVINDGEFHLTARRGIISLLEKLDKDPLQVNSWRPLSLLNTDNKIYAKVMANRLQECFGDIIHESQTGFIKNRYMSENIIKLQEIMEYTMANSLPGVVISFDFAKAFDTLEWPSIFTALSCFGFGDKYIDMV